MIEALQQTVDGAAIIKDWLGEGGVPVSQELAERRAMTCVCCPNNVEPRWWEKVINAIALTIRRWLSVKREMGLKTELDGDLHMCKSCGCCLELKVHVPIAHIKLHTKEFPDRPFTNFCWVKNEEVL